MALVLASAATLLVIMNYTAPIVTLPETAAGLHAGPSAQTWLLSSISVGLAAVLLITGSLADDRGRKRVFVGGAAVFTAATVATAAAPNAAVFIAARVALGAAAAALLAAGLGLVGHAYPQPHERVRATGVWGAMVGAGIALGPLIFAGLASVGGWRTGYWAFAAAGVLLVVAAVPLLPESRAPQPRPLDVPGSLTLGGGLAFLVAAVTEGRTGWLRPGVLLPTLAAVVLLAAFVAVEAVRREPMLDLSLFRRPLFVVASIGALFTGLAVIGPMSYLPVVLQRGLGMTPAQTAYLFTVWSGTSFLVALQARRLARRIAGRLQLASGLLLCGVGAAAMLGFVAADSWQRMVPGLFISGVGSGLLNAGLARLAVESVPAGRAGMGSGANNTARYVGSSVGVALTVAIVAAPDGAELNRGTNAALLVSAALAALSAVIAVVVRERPH
ncbi:MAG: MFS transporter [Micromonosporaceae bacterium]|nr:MFS transporter [Micromonosporaceae bacterium]